MPDERCWHICLHVCLALLPVWLKAYDCMCLARYINSFLTVQTEKRDTNLYWIPFVFLPHLKKKSLAKFCYERRQKNKDVIRIHLSLFCLYMRARRRAAIFDPKPNMRRIMRRRTKNIKFVLVLCIVVLLSLAIIKYTFDVSQKYETKQNWIKEYSDKCLMYVKTI